MTDCAWCGLPLPTGPAGIEQDHVIPRTRGGPDASWNRQPLHKACNRQKGDKLTPEAELLAQRHNVTLRLPFRERSVVSTPEVADLVAELTAGMGLRELWLAKKCAGDLVSFYYYAYNQLRQPRISLNALAASEGISKAAAYQRIQRGKIVAAMLPTADLDEIRLAISA